MMSPRKYVIGVVVSLATIAALTAFADTNKPDQQNSQTVSAPTSGGTVHVNINVGGHGVNAGVTVPPAGPGTPPNPPLWSAHRKALEIANAINSDPSNQTDGGPRCKATVGGANGDTVIVHSQPGFGPVSSFSFKANKTGEKDSNTGKDMAMIGTGRWGFSGTVGTPGTVTVGAGTMEFNFDVSTFQTIDALRAAVASTLTANGFSAYVGPEGTIFATIPAGMDGVSLCVNCETLNADLEGYQDTQQ